MAGHSKWANIKHRKGRQDAKRGKVFSVLIRELTVAAKLGGGVTGAKLMTTLLHELERREGKYGLQAICEGGGTANAMIIERLS